ncbi:hypothetical protein Golomagni_02396 [Golovinomyces magnicellulatus]|nr:hypothetical protein Golomagni_02396 [Golovinomyces magnicellulatus]
MGVSNRATCSPARKLDKSTSTTLPGISPKPLRKTSLEIISGETHDSKREKCSRREFQTEPRRTQRTSWRQFMNLVASSNTVKTKKCTSIQQGPPHLPALRRDCADIPTENNAVEATILKERFF